MRASGFAIAVAIVATPALLRGQVAGSPLPAGSLVMAAASARCWTDAGDNVIELHGPVNFTVDQTRLSARNAVVWADQPVNGEQRVRIALLGSAVVDQSDVERRQDRLLVSTVVRGNLRLLADRTTSDDHDSALYAQATALRSTDTPPAITPITPISPIAPIPTLTTEPSSQPTTTTSPTTTATTQTVAPQPAIAASHGPATAAALPPPAKRQLEFQVDRFDLTRASDGHLAAVLTGHVLLRYRDEKGNLLEFSSTSAVLFTDLNDTKALTRGGDMKAFISEHVQAAYFEGDVQVYSTPALSSRNELQMRAERVYYEFATDRAILTDVVLHTVDLKRQMPIFLRANVIRQLSQGEYNVDGMELSTSGFATPTYSLAAAHAYVHGTTTDNPADGEVLQYQADNVTFKGFGIPVLYLPEAGGTMSARGSAVRSLGIANDSQFGTGVRTQFGLFESLGKPAPQGLDAAYRLDYFSDRGPAGGIDAVYNGGFVSETTKDPWNFTGDLHAYFVDDRGTDSVGDSRATVTPPDEFRGRAYLQHQQFFPDNWQAQIQLGWVSDATFSEEWFPNEYDYNIRLEDSAYLKHTDGSEVFTLLAEAQPNGVITDSDFAQEQREPEHFPEVGYYRVGDSIADDKLTFFSENTAAALQFSYNGATLAQQGFNANVPPGEPSFAYTGDPHDQTYRGDFREELDYPIGLGPIKAVPYVFGRYTPYSQGVQPPLAAPQTRTLVPGPIDTTGAQNRFMAGGGARFSTSFWAVNDTAESDLFDIHRIRHVIEPEVNLLTSAQSIDQNRLFIYDESVDAVNDIQAAQVALRQRWETKRGGPGRWRSVDFFTLDVYGNFYGNQPSRLVRDPVDFRGLYFPTEPEASIPRNSINADAQWRVSDSTAILADISHNLDRQKFATGSIGVSVTRSDRLSYFFVDRYIADLDSNVATAEIVYALSAKYTVTAAQSFDFGQNKDVSYTFALDRKFDRFQAGIRFYYDQTTNENGFGFSLTPYGLGKGLGSTEIRNAH